MTIAELHDYNHCSDRIGVVSIPSVSRCFWDITNNTLITLFQSFSSVNYNYNQSILHIMLRRSLILHIPFRPFFSWTTSTQNGHLDLVDLSSSRASPSVSLCNLHRPKSLLVIILHVVCGRVKEKRFTYSDIYLFVAAAGFSNAATSQLQHD